MGMKLSRTFLHPFTSWLLAWKTFLGNFEQFFTYLISIHQRWYDRKDIPLLLEGKK
jgi:hypothetical protein